MEEFSEVTVRIKNEEDNASKKFACYNKITLARDCPALVDMVEKTKQVFRGVHGDVVVTARYEWGTVQD